MKTILKLAVFAVFLVAFTPSVVRGWSCPSGQIRQQAPAGTPTTAPYYDVVEGIAFICVPVNPPPSTSTTSPTQSQQQNQTQSSNSTSNSNSTANSASNSSSTSKATGGSANSTASGGSATATGGSSGVKNAGNSALTNSGNSSNTNSNSASNNSTGNTSTYDSNSTSNYTEVRQNPGAFAPIAAFTTSPCSKGYSAGGSSPTIAATLGIVTTDKGCDSRQTALNFYAIGNPAAAAQVLCSTDAAKRAHLTLKECLALLPPVVVAPPAIPLAPAAPQVIVVPVPAAVPPPAVPVVNLHQVTRLGTCPAPQANCVNRLLDQAILSLQSNDTAVIVLSGPVVSVPRTFAYLHSRGISPLRVVPHVNDIDTVSIAVEVN
jgi:hypothetical protein